MIEGRDLNRVVAGILAAGTAAFGYDQAVMGGVIGMPSFLHQFRARATGERPTEHQIGTMIALFEVGAGVGALACGRIADKLGRIKTLVLGCALVCLGTGLQAGASEFVVMNVGRVVAGLGIGAMMTTLPLLQSEVAPSNHRGKSQSIHWVVSVVGFALALWIDNAFFRIAQPWNWRVPIALQASLVIMVVLGLFIVPESPRWLASKGKMEAARKVLHRITEARDENDKRIKDKVLEAEIRAVKAERELATLQETIEAESRTGRTTLREMFKNENGLNIRKRTFLAMGIQTMQQLTGVNAFVYYQITIFNMAGITGLPAMNVAGVNAISYLISTLIPVFVIEKIGRKPLLIMGSIGQAAAMAVVGAMLILAKPYMDANEAVPTAYAYTSVAGVFAFMFIFGTAWLCIPWFMPAELFPQRQRGMGCALATLANFVFNALIGELVPDLARRFGGWLFVAFGVLNLVFGTIVWLCYPETAGLSLEEMDSLFEDKTHRKMKKLAN